MWIPSAHIRVPGSLYIKRCVSRPTVRNAPARAFLPLAGVALTHRNIAALLILIATDSQIFTWIKFSQINKSQSDFENDRCNFLSFF